MSTDAMTKTCGRCGSDLPLSEFGVDRSRADGLHPWCRTCKRASSKARYAADPDRFTARQRAYRQTHREQIRTQDRAYRRTEAYRARRRTYKRRLTEARRISNAVRSLRLRTKHLREQGIVVAGVLTITALRARLDYFGWRCWLCRAPWEHIDHVIPLARGGPNWPANIRPACASCNHSRR